MRSIIAVLALAVAARPVLAAPRAVVLPVVVGTSQEPTADLMVALARGLQDSAPWAVLQGPGIKAVYQAEPGLPGEDRAALNAKLEETKDKPPAQAAPVIDEVRKRIIEKSKTVLMADDDFAVLYRLSGALVGAYVTAGEPDKAKAVAGETALLLPGRKPTELQNLPPAAAELLAAAPGGARLVLSSRPEGCQVFVNGQLVGPAPAEVAVLAGASYQAYTICAADPGATERRSFPKHIAFGEKETSRTELLDAEFERGMQAEGGQRVRFASSQERRDLEESYARRIAERLSADLVVLASVGELSGADWLNARLYLRSGYLNRQGLVRLEPGRATALGRYLATGKDLPGVLRPEDAGALVAAAQAGPPKPVEADPWYTDIVGWSFAGVGAVGVGFGLWAGGVADDKTTEGDDIRGDEQQRQRLYREASRWTFLGNIGLVGGGLMAVTGVVLLAIPEYTGTQGELFVLSPLPGGGAQLGLRGRF